MAQAAFSIRMDEDLKRDFGLFCENVGMTMTTAFVIFAKATVREHRFPFEITERSVYREAEARLQIRKEARDAINAIRAERIANNEREWTLDEINAEIDAVRREQVR